jgi:SH3-like domain-containing protein
MRAAVFAFLTSRKRSAAAAAAVIVASLLGGAGTTMPDGRPTPTGQPVPRWLTLKSSEVRARQGPGLDYRILWEYRAAGLPVQVIAETREWRKICDPDGAVAWVHRTVVSSRRGAFNPSTHEAPIRTGRSDTSPLRARLIARSIIALESCEDGWCKVRARKLHGWVSERAVFGTSERPLCNASRPAGDGRR